MLPVLRRRRAALFAGLALLMFVALLYTHADVTLAGNGASRFGMTQALAEQGTLALENTDFRSVDTIQRNGHIYSDKPPMLSILAAVFWSIPHRVLGLNFHDNYGLGVYLVNLVLFGGTNLLLFCVFFRCLRRNSRLSSPMILGWGLALTLGTWVFSYSVTFNNHTPAALAGMFLFALLLADERAPSRKLAAWAGLTVGMAFSFDIPTGLFFGISGGVYFLASRRWRDLAAYCGGGGAVVAVLLFIGWIAYGTVLPLYIAGGTYGVGTGHLDKPFLGYFFNTLLGHRGLFSYQGLLLLLPFALFLDKRWLRRRAEWMILAGTAALVLFYCAQTNEYGGWAYGFRYLIPVIPIWFYFIARVFGEKRRFRRAAWAILPLGAAGLIAAFVGAYEPFCCAYEGSRTGPNEACYAIRSTFMSNLLAREYERNPDGAAVRFLVSHYSPRLAYRSLEASYTNRKDVGMLKQLKEHVESGVVKK